MTTIAELQTRMRRDLHDEGAARWTDTVLQRHLERAIREYSLAAPREVKTVLATAAGSRDLSIAGLTDMVSVAAVEWPVGQYPAEYVRFSIWQSTLSLLTDQLGDGSDVAVYWLALHAVDGSTLPPRDEEVIARGAAGYAALEWANFAINRVNIAGADTAAQYLAWGQAAVRSFEERLAVLRRRVVVSRLYAPAEPMAGQSRDVGP